MKKHYFENEDMTLVTGTGREIKSLYANMVNHGFFPVFTEEPKFNIKKMYGICYTGYGDTFEDGIRVVNADTIVAMLFE